MDTTGPAGEVAQLEAEKLRLEIAELGKPAYRRISFWTGIVVPIVACTLSLTAGYVTGFFDEELKKLKSEKTRLGEQLGVMSASLMGLTSQNRSLEADKQELESGNRKLAEDNQRLDQEVRIHRAAVDELKKKAAKFKTAARSAAGELDTLVRDTKELIDGKQSLFRLVDRIDMPPDRKDEIRRQFRQHLATIGETRTHVERVKTILQEMEAIE